MSTVAVREKPILFSSEMVRAIIEGRKSQTRRIVKPLPPEGWRPEFVGKYHPAIEAADGMMSDGPEIFGAYDEDWGVKCPYGGPGDHLWVRETWRPAEDKNFGTLIEYRAGGRRKPTWPDEQSGWKCEQDACAIDAAKWRPSIHMPRWASRITLEITGVRVERVQDIGRDGRKAHDVLAEGVPEHWISQQRQWFHQDDAPALAFAILWNQVNGKGAWERNDWVWVIEFKRLEPA